MKCENSNSFVLISYRSPFWSIPIIYIALYNLRIYCAKHLQLNFSYFKWIRENSLLPKDIKLEQEKMISYIYYDWQSTIRLKNMTFLISTFKILEDVLYEIKL